MSRYAVSAELEGRFWYVAIPALDGATQARHLREVDPMARDYIHNVTGEPPESIELEVELVMPPEAREHLDRQAKLRAEAAAKAVAASQEASAAAWELHSRGIPYRDIGALLGVSYQRAHQLVQGRRTTMDARDLPGSHR